MLVKCGRQVLLLSASPGVLLCSIVQLVLHGGDEVGVRGCLVQQHSPDEGRGAAEPHEGHPALPDEDPVPLQSVLRVLQLQGLQTLLHPDNVVVDGGGRVATRAAPAAGTVVVSVGGVGASPGSVGTSAPSSSASAAPGGAPKASAAPGTEQGASPRQEEGGGWLGLPSRCPVGARGRRRGRAGRGS